MRDSAETKRRILLAATEEFSEHGLPGGRVDRIAERAEANKQLIYRYFGSKERLFEAVLHDKLVKLAEAVPVDPERAVEGAGDLFDFYAANPDFVRLLLWESLSFQGKPVPSEAERRGEYLRLVDAVREAQANGDVDAAVDPAHAIVNILGLVAGWFTMPQLSRMITGSDTLDETALRRRRAQVVEATRRLLASR